MKRDLDLIAVPWVDIHLHRDTLAAVIHEAACGLSQDLYTWEVKPHGRLATSFPICWTATMTSRQDGCGHIDLSVMS